MRTTELVETVQEIAYHRNGICGNGFHVVRFTSEGDEFLATVFEAPGSVAVLSLSKLPVIAFGENSWRGDRYEDELRAAIAAKYAAEDVARGWTSIDTSVESEAV